MPLDNHFFEDILDKVPAEIMVADAEYRFLYANPVAVSDSHLREWMIGKTNEEFCQYSGRPTAMARARRMVFEKARRTRKPVEWSESLQDNEGVVQHFLHRIYPVFDAENKFQQVIIYVVRITETKEFEEKVKIHEKRYRDLFNYSQALICTHDLNGNFLAVNPSICRALNYSEGEMLGRNIRDMIPDKHRPRFEEE
jgi:PAS domain-containing protein